MLIWEETTLQIIAQSTKKVKQNKTIKQNSHTHKQIRK